MEVKFLKSTTKYVLIIIISLFIKIIMTTTISGSSVSLGSLSEEDIDINKDIIPKNIKIEYEEIDIYTDVSNFKKPKFNIKDINKNIDDYIAINSCENLDYNVYLLDNTRVSVFLNCGKPLSLFYDEENKKEFNFFDLVKNKEELTKVIKWLLNLKYPTFVTEEVEIEKGIYDIYENEIIGYFSTPDFGDLSIKINNNEIEDLMNYEMVYDEIYENEKYTLDKNKKAIAFTYDDGPSDYDLEIIDELVKSHSKATFFMVGNRMKSFKTSIDKMLQYGMETGNHSYDHKFLKNMNESQFLDELTRTNQLFNDLTGLDLKIFRPPYGSVKSSFLKEAGVSSILWSVDTLDWKSRDAESVYNIVMEEVKDGDIILMHSLYESTLEATKKLLPELYKMGYQIVTVTELFALKDKEIQIGNSYLSAR